MEAVKADRYSVVIPPHDLPYKTKAPNSARSLQGLLEGYFQVMNADFKPSVGFQGLCIAFINEDALVDPHQRGRFGLNFKAKGIIGTVVKGTVVLSCSDDEGEDIGMTEKDANDVLEFLDSQ